MPELAGVFIQPFCNGFCLCAIADTGKQYLGILEIGANFHRGYGHHSEIMILDVPLHENSQFSLDEISNPATAAEFFRHGLCPSDSACHLDTFKYFNLITGFDIIVIFHANTALGAGLHFAHIVLEPAQGFQFAFINHHVVA
jgi:hypothetical protein